MATRWRKKGWQERRLVCLPAEARFTYGSINLMGGVPFVVAMIGLFGVAEALVQLEYVSRQPIKQAVSRIVPLWSDVRKYLGLALRSSGLGTLIGALPGTGGDIAALMAYDQAKRTTKDPETPFGEGAKEGLIAPEAANNAAVGGAFVPMLTLGIPGDAVTAIIIGALFIHGLKPGPLLLTDTPHLFWFIVGNLTLANLFLLVFGLTGVRVFTKVVECPRAILIPLIVVLSAVGAYAIQNNPLHITWALAFGVIGYLLKRYGFQVGPIILGVISRPTLRNIRQPFEQDNPVLKIDVGLEHELRLVVTHRAVLEMLLVGRETLLRHCLR